MARTKKGSGGAGGSCSGTLNYPADGTSYTDATMCDIFFSASPPTVQIQGSPAFGLREVGNDVVNPDISARGYIGANNTNALTNLETFRGAVGGSVVGVDASPTPGTWYMHTDTFTISSTQTYSARVTDAGAGTGTASGSYTFVYPYYATTSSITVMTKQSLQASNTFIVDMVAEAGADNQKIDIVDTLTVTAIDVWNTLSSTWEF